MTCHLCVTSWTTRPYLVLDQLLSPFKRAHSVEGASPGSSLMCLRDSLPCSRLRPRTISHPLFCFDSSFQGLRVCVSNYLLYSKVIDEMVVMLVEITVQRDAVALIK